MEKAEKASPSCVLVSLRSTFIKGAKVAMVTRSTKRIRYIRQRRVRTMLGHRASGFVLALSRRGAGLAFNLRAVHDPAGVGIEGVAAMHAAAVIPQYEGRRVSKRCCARACSSFVGVGPELVEQLFGFGEGQSGDVGVAAAA